MSAASVHVNNRLGQGYQQDADDVGDHYYTESTILSIEEIRLQLYSCFTCGVSWLQDHVCLDCAECGGYSLHRPCPQCDGQCASSWKRDLTMSHACGKARWNGTCQLQSSNSNTNQSPEEKETEISSHIKKSLLRS